MWLAIWFLKIGAQSDTEAEPFSSLQYVECMTPLNILYAFLGCIYVRFSTDDEVGHIVEGVKGIRGEKEWSLGGLGWIRWT